MNYKFVLVVLKRQNQSQRTLYFFDSVDVRTSQRLFVLPIPGRSKLAACTLDGHTKLDPHQLNSMKDYLAFASSQKHYIAPTLSQLLDQTSGDRELYRCMYDFVYCIA